MDTYIGLDAHASSCTLGVLGPGGKRLGSHVVETNAKALIEGLRSIPGPRHLCLEEGTLASWLYEVLSPHVCGGDCSDGGEREPWSEERQAGCVWCCGALAQHAPSSKVLAHRRYDLLRPELVAPEARRTNYGLRLIGDHVRVIFDPTKGPPHPAIWVILV